MKTTAVYLSLCLMVFATACKTAAHTAYTTFTTTITHPDPSVDGREAVIMAEFYWIRGCPRMFYPCRFEGNSITTEIQAPETYFVNGKAEIIIAAFLFDDPQDKDIDLAMYKKIPSVLMSNYPEFHSSPKSRVYQLFTLQWDGNQIFNIDYPDKLNIRIDYSNEYYPVVIWDPYPTTGSILDYEVAIIVDGKNRWGQERNIEDTTWQARFKGHTKNTSIYVPPAFVSFHEGYGSDGIIIQPTLVPGDVFRIEVEPLDDIFFKGPLKKQFADSVTVLVK